MTEGGMGKKYPLPSLHNIKLLIHEIKINAPFAFSHIWIGTLC